MAIRATGIVFLGSLAFLALGSTLGLSRKKVEPKKTPLRRTGGRKSQLGLNGGSIQGTLPGSGNGLSSILPSSVISYLYTPITESVVDNGSGIPTSLTTTSSIGAFATTPITELATASRPAYVAPAAPSSMVFAATPITEGAAANVAPAVAMPTMVFAATPMSEGT